VRIEDRRSRIEDIKTLSFSILHLLSSILEKLIDETGQYVQIAADLPPS
jgi:hypothetical protein